MGAEQERPLQGSLFEEDYLVRTLGAISSSPDVALTELVANAWDAGASRVIIAIPSELGGELVVEDDGSGMTPDQFRKRWMTLGYDRTKHQGKGAEFPPERGNWRRQAYGRNGVGRHALLCFADEYEVQTRRDGSLGTFIVSTASGQDPFILHSEQISPAEDHGTRLSARIARNLPQPEKLRAILSSRFLSDPQFTVLVNGASVPLTQHPALVDRRTLDISDKVRIQISFLEVSDTSKRVLHHGIAFWIGRRLVGTPSWSLGDRVLLDGRTRLAKRHTVVVESDDLLDEVLPDWSSFRPSPIVMRLFEIVGDFVEEKLRELAADKIEETKEAVLREYREEMDTLQPLGKLDVREFVEELTGAHPALNQEAISFAVDAAIKIEKKRSGTNLLQRISQLSEEDIEELDRFLRDWSVRDALTVLDEIDRRLAVIEALARLSKDPQVDELHTLHPLITQARWLFGPEFDSPEYSSNQSLRNAAELVFQRKVRPEAFINPRKRPDLVILPDSTLSLVGTEGFTSETNLMELRSILLIEIKRGHSEIGRPEMDQAGGYVEDLLACGALHGIPYIHAYVVGHTVDNRIKSVRKVGDPESGRIDACTFGQLISTAGRRLFRLKEHLENRYSEIPQDALLKKVLEEPQQLKLRAS